MLDALAVSIAFSGCASISTLMALRTCHLIRSPDGCCRKLTASAMPAIHELIPNAENLLHLEPEELAPVLLQYVLSDSKISSGQAIKRGNLFGASPSPGDAYGPQYKERVNEALTSAWIWLEREGMLLPAPSNQDRDWVCL